MRPADSGRYPSGQRGQTVNLLAYAFGGSNPPLPTTVAGALEAGSDRGWAEIGATTRGTRVSALGERGALPARGVRFRGRRMKEVFVVLQSGGNSSAVERQPSKLGVAGSNPVSRSKRIRGAHGCAGGDERRGFGGHGAAPIDIEWAHVAQLAERVLGKDEVSGSIPDMGSINRDR